MDVTGWVSVADARQRFIYLMGEFSGDRSIDKLYFIALKLK